MSATQPYFFHSPGALGKGAVLDIGLKCTHSCKFCYYSYLDGSDDQFSGMRHAGFRSFEDCRQILTGLANYGFLNFDVTGGEPTLHPNIIELMRYAHQDLGLSGRIITLGQFLMRKMKGGTHDRLIDDLLNAGLTNFLFSMHAADEDMFKAMTGESFAKLRAAMDHLDAKGFDYTSNTTVIEGNYKALPDIAREVTRHNIYLHNFIFMNAYFSWNKEGRAFGVQIRYQEALKYLAEAVAILEDAGIGANVRYSPLCGLPGFEKHIVGIAGVRYDPYEWLNNAGHMGGAPDACAAPLPIVQGECDANSHLRLVKGKVGDAVPIIGVRSALDGSNIQKVFPEICQRCHYIKACDGYDVNYAINMGVDYSVPYASPQNFINGPLTPERQKYAAPFFVKRQPGAAMKTVVKRVLRPDPISADPLVSVVVTCYNYGAYLEQAVDSALKQSWHHLEVLIVNDGSTDNSREVGMMLAARAPDRVRYLEQPNSGQPALSRNFGISHAKGELIQCLDADDYIAATKVEESIWALRRNPTCSIVATNQRNFGDNEDIVRVPEYDFGTLLKTCTMNYCSIYKRQVWDEVGGYRDNIVGCEDWDFWVAAGGLGHFATVIPRALFHYRVKGDGVWAEQVKGSEDLKHARIILNNTDLYPRATVKEARAKLGL